MTDAERGAWPSSLWIVRHGESAGNVARDRAEAARKSSLEIDGRDVDVPLSPLGRRQSLALGRWFGRMPAAERPTVVLSSPYIRAIETATLIREAAGLDGGSARNALLVLDERLREKEFGMFNRLTGAGIAAAFPEQAALRASVGKFYYRPPSGESWCDVLLRLRGALQDVQLQYRGGRVLIVAHQVIVLCFRYLLERMTEAQILEIDAQKDVANCGVTSYVPSQGGGGVSVEMELVVYNFVAPLEEAGEPVTQAPDTPVEPR